MDTHNLADDEARRIAQPALDRFRGLMSDPGVAPQATDA
jgi:hypothetical protein